MKVTIRPVAEPEREIDLTDRMLELIVDELTERYGGNRHINRLEAESHLSSIVRARDAELQRRQQRFQRGADA